MIVLQGVEVKLKEAKAGDMVTVEKLASIDEKKVSGFLDDACICMRSPRFNCAGRVLQSGFVAFGHFLVDGGALHGVANPVSFFAPFSIEFGDELAVFIAFGGAGGFYGKHFAADEFANVPGDVAGGVPANAALAVGVDHAVDDGFGTGMEGYFAVEAVFFEVEFEFDVFGDESALDLAVDEASLEREAGVVAEGFEVA